ISMDAGKDLREIFAKYGPISNVAVVYDQQSRRSRGFAFVYFESVDNAKEAREGADGLEVDGRRIRVDFSITKRPHTPTPGVYMGRPTYGRRSVFFDRGVYERASDRDYYCSRPHRGAGGVASLMGSRGGWRSGPERDLSYRRHSPSPYYNRRYRSHSRSRPYSPHHF
uniref:RRM domain-containing protein n=1 Tax=Monodelphis domestica TaxID=13616 RepID=F6U355_MONDO